MAEAPTPKSPDTGIVWDPPSPLNPAAAEGSFRDLPGALMEAYQSVGTGLSRAREAGTQSLQPFLHGIAPWVNPIPGNVPDLILTLLLGRMGPAAGGSIKQILKGAGKGALAGATLKGGEALATDQPFLPAVAQGAAGGAPGGALVGTGHALAVPSKPVQQTQRSILSAQAQSLPSAKNPVSENVTRSLNVKDPESLYSRESVTNAQRAASRNIEQTVQEVVKAIGGETEIFLPSLSPRAPRPTTQRPVPLRQAEYMVHPITGETSLKIAVKDVQPLIRELRKAKNDKLAWEVEQEFMGELAKRATGLDKKYMEGIAQYARDATFIRWLTATQKKRLIPGKVSAVDYPGLAEASQALGDLPSRGLRSRGYHALMGALYSLKGALPFAAAHGAMAVKGGGVGVGPPLGRLQGPLPRAGPLIGRAAGVQASHPLMTGEVP